MAVHVGYLFERVVCAPVVNSSCCVSKSEHAGQLLKLLRSQQRVMHPACFRAMHEILSQISQPSPASMQLQLPTPTVHSMLPLPPPPQHTIAAETASPAV